MTDSPLSPAPNAAAQLARKGRFWMLLPFVLLGAMLLGWGYMVSVALDDPSFSVEADYYEKAIGWDAHQAEVAHNQELGWQLTTQLEAQGGDVVLAATLRDARGAPLSGARVSVEAFPVARGTQVLNAVFTERGGGVYAAALPMRRVGLWELRFVVERGGERFTAVKREELLGRTR